MIYSLSTTPLRRSDGRRRPLRTDLRAGFTLMELLFVIATTTMLMVVCVKWMSQSMKFSSTVRTLAADHQTLDQIGRQFRTDVRNCKSMAIAGNALMLETDSGELTYTIEKQTLIAKQPLSGTDVRSAQYRFKKGMEMRWDTDEMPASIGLIVERKEKPPTAPQESLSRSQSQTTAAADAESRSRIELFIRARPRQ